MDFFVSVSGDMVERCQEALGNDPDGVLFQIPGRAGVRKDRPVKPDAYAGREGYERRLVRDDRELLRGNDREKGEDQGSDEAAQGEPAAGGKQLFEHEKPPV